MSDFLLKNPWTRAFIPLVLMGIASLAGNVLASDITSSPDASWSTVYLRVPFYILLISTSLLCTFQVTVSKYDRALLKGFTAKQYEAAVRNRVAEDVAKRSKQLINEGNIDQLEKETEVFKRLYGENK